MDIERYEQLVRDPRRSCQDLQVMRQNAVTKGAVLHATLVEHVLDERFPGWRIPTRRGGSDPTTAMFCGDTVEFPYQKEAYIWLLDHFVAHCPGPFARIDWQTHFIAKGPRTLYFSRSLKKLFATSPQHAADPTKYHRMRHGWFAKLILNKNQKFEILLRFAAIAKLRWGEDWDWDATSRLPLPDLFPLD